MPTDKVTICLFSVVNKDGYFNEMLFQQKENILRIKNELTAAAIAAGREPPEIIVSVSLVPCWSKVGAGYENEDYLATQKKFLGQVKDNFEPLGVTIQDFYREARLTDAEKKFMHGLEALGSNLDMMKFRALINNQDVRHLQLDSNTQIYDYSLLYKQTFAAEEQKDALNACYYDHHYISAHSKVLYTTPTGLLAPTLERKYLAYCEGHQDDVEAKGAKKNRIYSRTFVEAADEIGLARRVEAGEASDKKVYYPALMDRPEYRISQSIATAVNMSWSAKVTETAAVKALAVLPPVQIGSAACDFQCFAYIVKKYTGDLSQHAIGSEQEIADVRQQFLSLFNEKLDHRILAEFYNNVCEKYPQKVAELARIFPDTLDGDKLCQRLFQCNVVELHENPFRQANRVQPEPNNSQSTSVQHCMEMKKQVTQMTQNEIQKEGDDKIKPMELE